MQLTRISSEAKPEFQPTKISIKTDERVWLASIQILPLISEHLTLFWRIFWSQIKMSQSIMEDYTQLFLTLQAFWTCYHVFVSYLGIVEEWPINDNLSGRSSIASYHWWVNLLQCSGSSQRHGSKSKMLVKLKITKFNSVYYGKTDLQTLTRQAVCHALICRACWWVLCQLLWDD